MSAQRNQRSSQWHRVVREELRTSFHNVPLEPLFSVLTVCRGLIRPSLVWNRTWAYQFLCRNGSCTVACCSAMSGKSCIPRESSNMVEGRVPLLGCHNAGDFLFPFRVVHIGSGKSRDFFISFQPCPWAGTFPQVFLAPGCYFLLFFSPFLCIWPLSLVWSYTHCLMKLKAARSVENLPLWSPCSWKRALHSLQQCGMSDKWETIRHQGTLYAYLYLAGLCKPEQLSFVFGDAFSWWICFKSDE